MPRVAKSMGAVRDPPSSWEEPNPTLTAPRAAMMPHSQWPVNEPMRIARAIAGMQRNAARGWKLIHSGRRTSRRVSVSMGGWWRGRDSESWACQEVDDLISDSTDEGRAGEGED